MTYDTLAKRIVFLYQDGYYRGTKTYLLDPAADVWTEATQDDSAKTVNVSASGIAYDMKRHLVVTLGGGTQYDSASPSLRTYSVAQNTWASLHDCPIDAIAAGFDYDSTPTTSSWRSSKTRPGSTRPRPTPGRSFPRLGCWGTGRASPTTRPTTSSCTRAAHGTSRSGSSSATCPHPR